MPYPATNAVPPSHRTLRRTARLRRTAPWDVRGAGIGATPRRSRRPGHCRRASRRENARPRWRRHWQGWARVRVGRENLAPLVSLNCRRVAVRPWRVLCSHHSIPDLHRRLLLEEVVVVEGGVAQWERMYAKKGRAMPLSIIMDELGLLERSERVAMRNRRIVLLRWRGWQGHCLRHIPRHHPRSR